MDRDFMRLFYERYYENPASEAIRGSEKYHNLQGKRQEIESVLEEKLRVLGNDIMQLFDEYMDALVEEQEMLLKEMYLLGAEDREKMLRGIIR